jgi:hypothetical protein
MRGTIEKAFQRKGNEPFHIFGSHSWVLGDDVDQRGVEIGIDVFRHSQVRDDTPDRNQENKEDSEQPMF